MVWLDRGIFVFGFPEDSVALSVALVASIANGVIEPVLTLLISRMFQEVSNVAMASTESNDAMSRVSACAAGIFAVGVLCVATNWISAMSWGYLGAKQSARARRLVFRALIYKDMTWFNTTISVTSLISTAYKYVCPRLPMNFTQLIPGK
jgi:ABC-type multidrug transport system fused ATPase/permease subunit